MTIDWNALIGQKAAVAYRSILLADSDVSTITICQYDAPPSLQQRVTMSDYENAIVEAALLIRKSTKLPFWEALFSACISSGECRDSLIDATFYHGGQGLLTTYNRSDVAAGILERVATDDARNIAISSRVELGNGEQRHLTLLDFHCDVSASNAELVQRICRRLLPSGFVVLDSGDSYHATSMFLGTNDERVKTLGKALCIAPIVDSTYIAHQLQQDASSLRISKGGKRRQFPIVVDCHVP